MPHFQDIQDEGHEKQSALRQTIAEQNLERLEKFRPPSPPNVLPEMLADELPLAVTGATANIHRNSMDVQTYLLAHHETLVGGLLMAAQPKESPKTLRSRIRAWVAAFLGTWLGALGALLGAPRILDFSLSLSLLTKWTEDNQKNICAAQKRQVFGHDTGKPSRRNDQIHWQCSFFAFLESTAMYLRDVRSHFIAWEAFQNAKTAFARKEAVKEYNNAYEAVDKLAHTWNMEFLPIELIDNKGVRWDGPICGIFYTTQKQAANPFIGVAFKGTNPLNIKEWTVDFDYKMVAAHKKHFRGDDEDRVSRGVYNSLFGGDRSAYDMILGAIRDVAHNLVPNESNRPIPVHVTGHSLGGSYATMCYSQLLRDLDPNKSPSDAEVVVMGDAYTFGAPRVAGKKWTMDLSQYIESHNGKCWRIVNNNDLVPVVPPTTLQPTEVAFHHVDTGVQIWPHKPPRYLLSEHEQPDPRPYPIKSILFLLTTMLRSIDHIPHRYYASLQHALERKGKTGAQAANPSHTTLAMWKDNPRAELVSLAVKIAKKFAYALSVVI